MAWGDDDDKGGVRARAALDGTILSASIEREPLREAVHRGLVFLAAQQATAQDGSLPAGQGDYRAPVGVTALTAIAFMASGNTPGRGEYGDEVAAAVDYLLSRVKPEDDERAGYIGDEADRKSGMHGHGLATLALAQAYIMSPASPRGRRTAQALVAGVHLIERTQGAEGGWMYDPVRDIHHEGSVTVCLVQGLRAARNAGILVDTRVIARAIDYVKRLQNPEGSFRYGLNKKAVSVALTAACLSTLHATGIYEGREIDDGYGYVWRELAFRRVAEERGGRAKRARFPFYERFYLAQALWQHPDQDVYRRWAREEVERILVDQNKNGSWSGSLYGDSYATAMNCLFLAVPDGLLPIFQR